MRALTIVLAISLLAAACGGSEDTSGAESTEQQPSTSSDLDPCSLVDDDTLGAYFGGAVPESETATHGPIETCAWRDANANSLLVQTAQNYDLLRLDECDECVDLTYGDDGYAAPGVIQSSATFVVGDMWYSVTTTGFGDDADAIAGLGETILTNTSQ